MRSFLTLSLVAAWGCGSGSAAPVEQEPTTLNTAHFAFTYTALDKATIAQTAAALEAEFPRIVADLGGSAPPVIRVWLYSDHAELERALTPLIGAIPSWAIGAAPSRDQIHMMSPNHAGSGSYATMMTNLVHEFAHCITLHHNRTIGNNPRWFWEAVAAYEARQQVDPKTVAYMAALTPPTFASLSSFDNNRIYEVGYTIGEFIVTRWGQPKLAELVSNNANISVSLGMPQAQFEQEWFTFVRQRYGF
jgi:hypothetical protein